jgi:hypothetical protein
MCMCLSGSRDALVNGKYDSYLADHKNTLIYPFCLHVHG